MGVCVLLGFALGGCSPKARDVSANPASAGGQSPAPAPPPAAPPPGPQPSPPPLAPPSGTPNPAGLTAQAVNESALSEPSPSPQADAPETKNGPPNPVLIRAEILLARTRFSPGVIDGKPGENLRRAVAAFQSHAGLSPTGTLDQETFAALSKANSSPVLGSYQVTGDDLAGPFAPDVGENFIKLAALPQGPLFSSAREALAARFHMSQELLTALNPGIDFRSPGVTIVVTNIAVPDFSKGEVDHIDVSKADKEVTAFGADSQVLAVYPATVGSKERPSPSGTHKILGVAWNTDYTYDPSKLKWGPRNHGKLHIKPGPKNPVGVVWIALNAPDYGIHGTPDPTKIGKTASHGCVRLTNWDALALAHGVKPGVKVRFLGAKPIVPAQKKPPHRSSF